MAKREFVMLCHKYDPIKHRINGWMASEKLDGIRAIWDGGITRGMRCNDVPWINIEKDGRYVQTRYATGLLTRAGKPIYAPDWFLDKLPNYPLDGELFIDRQSFQKLTSIVKTLIPGPGWEQVRYVVFDAPSFTQVFSDGDITATQFRKKIRGCAEFLAKFAPKHDFCRCLSFDSNIKWLRLQDIENEVVQIHEQEQLPFSTTETNSRVDWLLQSILDKGGEGLILRRHTSLWMPCRSWDLLKYKPFNDAEGIVTGFVWGRKTDKGSKLLGKVGALVLNYKGLRLELSGFTDDEREVKGPNVGARGVIMAGEEEHDPAYCPKHFPPGTSVTFRYRELSDIGIPKEARFLRERSQLEEV